MSEARSQPELRETRLLEEVEQLILEGVIHENLRDSFFKRPAPIASSRASNDVLERAEAWVDKLSERHPRAMLILGDTKFHKAVGERAVAQDLRVRVFTREECFVQTADCLDELIVATSNSVVCFDDSTRSQHYKRLAKTQRKKVISVT